MSMDWQLLFLLWSVSNKMSKQTEYERKNDLVSREELIKNVPDLMKDLNYVDFHSLYHLLWTLSTHRMLERMRREREAKVTK